MMTHEDFCRAVFSLWIIMKKLEYAENDISLAATLDAQSIARSLRDKLCRLAYSALWRIGFCAQTLVLQGRNRERDLDPTQYSGLC